jgi:hypothetical protein
MFRSVLFFLLLVLSLLTISHASAFDGDFKGSLAQGKHEHYVPPVSNPFLNETPFITTEARLIYMHNDVPGKVLANTFSPGTPGGGHINLFALQLRLALTDRLGFYVNKFGVADFNHTSFTAFDDSAMLNLSLGVKYALLSDPEQGGLVTLGMGYEVPSGTLKAGVFRLQGDGKGLLNLFVTASKSVDKWGMQAKLGTRISLDQDRTTSWLDLSMHMDYEILPDFFPLIELNHYAPINDPRQNTFNFSGLDLFDIGGADPQVVTTLAFGGRYKFSRTVMAGLVYETPGTSDKDIMDWRVTADLVINY